MWRRSSVSGRGRGPAGLSRLGARLGAVLLLLVAGAVWKLLPALPDQAPVVGAVRVVDGDTLVLDGRSIRLDGIDAPESRQTCDLRGSVWACGTQATQQLSQLVQGRAVSCSASGLDRYGRTLARCSAGGQDLGAAMVRQGWAVAYTRYSWRYLPEELRARWDGAGLWAGRFEQPEDWRRAHTR